MVKTTRMVARMVTDASVPGASRTCRLRLPFRDRCNGRRARLLPDDRVLIARSGSATTEFVVRAVSRSHAAIAIGCSRHLVLATQKPQTSTAAVCAVHVVAPALLPVLTQARVPVPRRIRGGSRTAPTRRTSCTHRSERPIAAQVLDATRRQGDTVESSDAPLRRRDPQHQSGNSSKARQAEGCSSFLRLETERAVCSCRSWRRRPSSPSPALSCLAASHRSSKRRKQKCASLSCELSPCR